MTSTSDPMTAFAIERVPAVSESITYRQFIGSALVDHRGDVGVSAIAALAEIVAGASFYQSQPAGTATVQSRLTLSVPAPVSLGTFVRGYGRVLGAVGEIGSTFVELIDDTDTIVCASLGRGVVVSRAPGKMPQPPVARPSVAVAQALSPEPLDPSLTGAEVLRKLADSSIPMGPVQHLLGLRVVSVTDNQLKFTVSPRSWMANNIGSMLGGVILANMTEICSMAVELTAESGPRYRIGDICVDFLRSPALDEGDLTVTVEPLKTGRRVTSVVAAMIDAKGTLLTQATAAAIR